MDAVFLERIVIFGLFFMSVVAHEVSHGWTALHLGDPTAKTMGRLTFNPIKHIDPFMTIILPIAVFVMSGFNFIFGGAKPVPINPHYLRRPERDMMFCSIAGPLTNILLGLFFTIPLVIMASMKQFDNSAFNIFFTVTSINMFLAMFNLIPIPPLDGSRVIRYFMPDQIKAGMDRMERSGMILVFAIIILFQGPIFDLFDIIIKAYFNFVLPNVEIQ